MPLRKNRLIGLLLAATLSLGIVGCSKPELSDEVPLDLLTSALVRSSLSEVPSTKTSFDTTLTIEGGALFADDLGVDALSLSDGFMNMQVTSVDRIDDTTITTSITGEHAAEPGGSPYAYGTITLPARTIQGSDEDNVVQIKIIQPAIGVVSEAMTFDSGEMDVYLSLHGSEFSENLRPDMFTVVSQGKTLEVTAVERTHAIETRLRLAMSAKDLEDAIGQLHGGTVSVSADGVTIGTALHGPTTISGAHIEGFISSIDASDNETRITTILSPVRGYLDNLTKDSLIFAGDFANAYDVEVTPTELGNSVSFSIPKLETIEEAIVFGNISTADGVLKNMWGSDARDISVAMRWGSGSGTKSVDTAKAFWSEYGDTISGIGSGVSNAFKATTTILEFLGVMESTNAKLDKIYDEMNAHFAATNQKLNEMHYDITSLLHRSDEILNRLAESARQSERGLATAQWNTFYADLKRLENLTDSYRNHCLSELINIVKNDSVTVYKDTKGTVSVLDRVSGRANTGYNMAPNPQMYPLPEDFVAEVVRTKKFSQHSLSELQELLVDQYGAVVAQEIIDSISLQAVYIASLQPKFNDYTTLFHSVAGTLSGHTLSTNNPLHNYDILVDSVFNWDTDTHATKNQMRLYLSTALADAAIHVFSYVGTIESGVTGEIEKVQRSLDSAASTLSSNTGVRTAPKHFAYNTHLKQPVTIRVAIAIGVNYSTTQPGIHFGIDSNGNSLSDRPAVYVGHSLNNQAALPELFDRPVLSSDVIELMAHNAKLRNTTYSDEILAVGLGPDDMRTEDGYPNCSQLHKMIKFRFNGAYWGYTAEYFNWQGKTSTAETELMMMDKKGATRMYGAPLQWAFFSTK